MKDVCEVLGSKKREMENVATEIEALRVVGRQCSLGGCHAGKKKTGSFEGGSLES
jgi:hypothetical protein